MPTNNAAWLSTYSSPLEVKEAPYPTPSPTQLLIRTHALAINPVDWGTQLLGATIFPWLNLPTILGSDISGTITSLGSAITNSKFKIGSRVVGQGLGFLRNRSAEGTFQEYVLLEESMVCEIPEDVRFEDACVLPLGLSTAASGLFDKKFLGLEFPNLEEGGRKGRRETVLIWGGSTSVGCNAVQLAVAAGYEVVSTSSPKNFDLVRKLGAMEVFDYNSPTIVSDLVTYLEVKSFVGAFAIGAPTSPRNGFSAGEACLEIVEKSKGRKFVAMAMQGPAELAPEGVEAKFVDGWEFNGNEVGKMIYLDFLPRALAEGKYICAPEAVVVGHGLEKIQEALDLQMKGVSAQKIVVTL